MKLKELRKQWLSDPDVQSAFEAQAPEFEVARTLIKTRLRVEMTHAQVAEQMGTTQSVVARMEGGSGLPSLRSIQRYADAVGCRPHFDLLPADGYSKEG